MPFFFFDLMSFEPLNNISRYKVSEIRSLLDHQHNVRKRIIHRSKQIPQNHGVSDICGTKGGQLICKGGESIVDGSNIFTLMTREAMEFASESVNASIFLSRDTFTNLFEIVQTSFAEAMFFT